MIIGALEIYSFVKMGLCRTPHSYSALKNESTRTWSDFRTLYYNAFFGRAKRVRKRFGNRLVYLTIGGKSTRRPTRKVFSQKRRSVCLLKCFYFYFAQSEETYYRHARCSGRVRFSEHCRGENSANSSRIKLRLNANNSNAQSQLRKNREYNDENFPKN